MKLRWAFLVAALLACACGSSPQMSAALDRNSFELAVGQSANAQVTLVRNGNDAPVTLYIPNATTDTKDANALLFYKFDPQPVSAAATTLTLTRSSLPTEPTRITYQIRNADQAASAAALATFSVDYLK